MHLAALLALNSEQRQNADRTHQIGTRQSDKLFMAFRHEEEEPARPHEMDSHYRICHQNSVPIKGDEQQ